MQTKILEVRDRATCIPMLCVNMNPIDTMCSGYDEIYAVERYWLGRKGYPCDFRPNILMTRLEGYGPASNDPYSWGDRTFATAHNYITDHWDELKIGDVVDVEFILGETKEIKVSERLESTGG